MPIFEFVCNSCGEEFEELVFGKQSIKCPKCKSPDIIRKISSFASIIKGSPHRSLDCLVGDDANKKWEKIYADKDKKLKEKKKISSKI